MSGQGRRVSSTNTKSSVRPKSSITARLSSSNPNHKNATSKLSVNKRGSTQVHPKLNSGDVKNASKSQHHHLQKLPSLPYQVADEIIQLIGLDNLNSELIHILRKLGGGFTAVIDYVYLPVIHKSASFWYPYMEEEIPDGALERSYGKIFKLSSGRDCQIFQRLCKDPKNSFPAKEIKLWCDSSRVPLFWKVQPSLQEVAKQIWSFTFVIGSTLQSFKFLYDALAQMTNLEDLRIICTQKEMEAVHKEMKSYTSRGKQVPYPRLSLPPRIGGPKLSCLNITGYTGSFILDDLFLGYGKRQSLKALEVGGQAVKISQVLANHKDSSGQQQLFPGIEKLKICGGDNYTLSTLSNTDWPLTHVSISWNWKSKESQAKFATLSKILNWLIPFKETLTELHLYVGCPITNERRHNNAFFCGHFPNVRKLGLPYVLAIRDSWIILLHFKNINTLELHDWTNMLEVGERGREANTWDINNIHWRLGRFWGLRRINTISVWSGKTEKTEIYRKNEDDF